MPKSGSRKETITIGVTGGIGSGKSTVCSFLETLGARVFRADDVGKTILASDPKVREEIIDAFGPASYRRDGRLNRAFLAAEVFNDAEKLGTINAIVHPRVFRAFTKVRRQTESEGVPMLVHEAALLFEAGGDRHVDRTVYVDAPRRLRIQRVVQRDGTSPEKVMQRIRHQLPATTARRKADYVIRNDGDSKRLEARIRRLVRRIEKDLGVTLVRRPD